MKVRFIEPTHIGSKRFAADDVATLDESAQLTRAIRRGWASEVKPKTEPKGSKSDDGSGKPSKQEGAKAEKSKAAKPAKKPSR